MNKITGHGHPHNHLKGEVGQWYEDLDTGDIYECRQSHKYSPLHGAPVGGYIWTLRVTGEDIEELFLPESVATKEYVNELLGVIENGTY